MVEVNILRGGIQFGNDGGSSEKTVRFFCRFFDLILHVAGGVSENDVRDVSNDEQILLADQHAPDGRDIRLLHTDLTSAHRDADFTLGERVEEELLEGTVLLTQIRH
jgi:myosin-crossreactive antigen